MKQKYVSEREQKMRLYNIYYLCKEYIEDMDILIFEEKGSGSLLYYRLSNWAEYKKILFAIRQIECMKESIDQLYETVPVYVREKEAPDIDGNTKSRVQSQIHEIIKKMQTIIDLYESMQLREGGRGIDVKIPPCDSLDKYISYMKDIEFVFNQCPFLQHPDGKITFNTVDVGSQWLSFVIATSAGIGAVSYILNNLALLIDKAIQIRSHLMSLKQQEEILRTQKLGNAALESVLETYEELKKYYLSEARKEMEEHNKEYPLKDGEERGKAEKSLEKLSSLLDKGVEIYASIDTDREMQALFPALGDNVMLPDDIIRYLEDKHGKEN